MPSSHAIRLCLALGLGAWLILSCSPADETPKTAATYVGRATCKACHEKQHADWHGSHHDLAMQPANEATVLGNFSDATFEHFGTTSKFYRDGDKFKVRTDGPDGGLTDFEVSYVFGVYPLQSYLIKFPRGRMQTLSICWDARPKAEGGQRWYHLYQERITHDDPLHWTGRAQNWNYMCANCHSTNLRKNYDLATDTFNTTWSEIDVSCETCHGPASHHVDWAKDRSRNFAHQGFAGPIKNDVTWGFEEGKVTATKKGGAHANLQTETCARCHSRRSTMKEGHVHGRLHDTEQVSLLDPLLYHADGQILDEVYVYGSFVQSKMFHAGVTCTDCHDPHTLKPLAPGNALCVRCHQAATFDTPKHHHHEVGGKGAACVACHMPTKHYMVVDPRLDHSIRIPRPDLTASVGTPNACNQCHADKSAKWAADAISRWKPDYRPAPHYGEALHAGREGHRNAAAMLNSVLENQAMPGIARATALSLIRNYVDTAETPAIRASVSDPDPLVRRSALESLVDIPAARRLEIVGPALEDPVRAVRIAAARVLASVPKSQWSDILRPAFDRALAEYEAFHTINGDQPWANTNLGIVQFQQHRFDEAKASYRRAIARDKNWVHAYINLADLHRHRSQEDRCEKVLREGLTQMPDSADLNYSLGLTLHRRKNARGALVALARAARLGPDVPRYRYMYGVALHSTGKFDEAIRVLEAAHKRFPRHFDILYALASYHLGANKIEESRRWARELYELAPQHPHVKALVQDLQRRR